MVSRTMASTLLFFTFAIACPLFLFTFQSQAASNLDFGRGKASKFDSQKVNLSVYYDTLNPNCSSFIVKNLAQVFDQDLITILNLRFVPWGDAHFNKSTNATICQVSLVPLSSFFFFIHCVFPPFSYQSHSNQTGSFCLNGIFT